MLARPRVPPASRLTPGGSETFAVTVAAGPEPVLSTLNPTMPVVPCDSVPTGLIRAAIWACGAGAVDGDAGVGTLPGAAEDGAGAAAAGWLPGPVAGAVAGSVGADTWPGWVGTDAGAAPGVPGTEPGAPGTAPGAPGTDPGTLGPAPGAPGTEPGAPGSAPGAPGTLGPDPGAPGTGLDGPEPGWREADELGPEDDEDRK